MSQTSSIRLDETPRLTRTIHKLRCRQSIYSSALFPLDNIFFIKPCYRIAFTLSALLPNRALNRTFCGGPRLGYKILAQTRPAAKCRLACTLGTTRKTRELNQFGSTRRLASQEEFAIPVFGKALAQASFTARTVLFH